MPFIDSESRHEKKFAQRLITDLTAIGCEIYMYDTMDKTGSDTGNVYATLPGNAPGEPMVLCAHMDTVVPGVGVKPVVEDGVVHSTNERMPVDELGRTVQMVEELIKAE